MAAKKKANTGSANAAEKRVMDTKKKAKAVGQNRNDQAGRSGMGETATSNLKSKSAGGKKFVSAAEQNARAASYKAMKGALKKSGNKKTPSVVNAYQNAYAKSMYGAQQAARKKKK